MKLNVENKYFSPLFLLFIVTLSVLFGLVFSRWFLIDHIYDQDQNVTGTRSLPYLKTEEALFIEDENKEETEVITVDPTLFEYIEVIDSCGSYFEGECLNVRSGPGKEFSVIGKLREGQVLKVGGEAERDGEIWYKIVFDEWIRYPERLSGEDWYVSSSYVDVLLNEGIRDSYNKDDDLPNKKIVVSRNEQMLYAYEGEKLFMEESISTGVELTPTPRGEFRIFRKTPTRYMQGPLPGISDKYWDLPGVPWNLYFTHQGAIIHGTYWHNNFGTPSSNGCVNIHYKEAKKLYNWAELGTKVIVKD